MAWPELLINAPTPGTQEAEVELKAELSEAGTEMELEANVPTKLQKAGEYRIIFGSEIIRCEGKAEATKKVKLLERGAEGTTKVAHAAKTKGYHVPTQGSLENGGASLGVGTVAMAYRKAAQKLKNALATQIEFDTAIKDPNSLFKLGAGEHFYEVPAEGCYAVSANVTAEAIPGGKFVYLKILVAGTEKVRGTQLIQGALEAAAASTGSGIVFAKAKDKIEVQGVQEAGSEKNLALSEAFNFLHVVRVA